MTAKTTIALLDSAVTPESPGTPAAATRTFIPGEVEAGNVHTFYENTTGSTAATRSKLTIQFVPGAVVNRVKIGIATPKAKTVDGVVVLAHTTRVNMEFLLPVDGSRDDRQDIRVLAMNALVDASIVNMIKELEGLY